MHEDTTGTDTVTVMVTGPAKGKREALTALAGFISALAEVTGETAKMTPRVIPDSTNGSGEAVSDEGYRFATVEHGVEAFAPDGSSLGVAVTQ